METDGSGVTQAVYTNEPVQYGSLVSQRRGSTTSWYHYDALGSTRQLTDAGQNATDSYLYDAWGNLVTARVPAKGGQQLFPQQEFVSTMEGVHHAFWHLLSIRRFKKSFQHFQAR